MAGPHTITKHNLAGKNASVRLQRRRNPQVEIQNKEPNVEGKYLIYKRYESSATSVLFLQSEQGKKCFFCAKTWLPCTNEVYYTNTLDKRRQYTIEGLAYNRQFAHNIYLGIAPIIQQDNKTITLGKLIKHPNSTNIDLSAEYVTIMKELKQSSRLDLQLQRRNAETNVELQRLAIQIARMHEGLTTPLQNQNILEATKKKWHLNQQCLHRAIKKSFPPFLGIFLYLIFYLSMSFMHKTCGKDIQQRQGKVKRCHGDLKTNNIWVVGKQFNALDCVDFQPDFCNIDTLSDVAMLAMDLEVQLSQQPNLSKREVRSLLKNFIEVYLNAMEENNTLSRLLLEYYVTEKAIVCAYMCILFDSEFDANLLEQGKKYLKTALSHAGSLFICIAKKPLKQLASITWFNILNRSLAHSAHMS